MHQLLHSQYKNSNFCQLISLNLTWRTRAPSRPEAFASPTHYGWTMTLSHRTDFALRTLMCLVGHNPKRVTSTKLPPASTFPPTTSSRSSTSLPAEGTFEPFAAPEEELNWLERLRKFRSAKSSRTSRDLSGFTTASPVPALARSRPSAAYAESCDRRMRRRPDFSTDSPWLTSFRSHRTENRIPLIRPSKYCQFSGLPLLLRSLQKATATGRFSLPSTRIREISHYRSYL